MDLTCIYYNKSTQYWEVKISPDKEKSEKEGSDQIINDRNLMSESVSPIWVCAAQKRPDYFGDVS